MKTYHGYRQMQAGNDSEPVSQRCVVTVEVDNGPGHSVRTYPLHLGLDIRDHSPTGFEWGYGGSGPAQLALALVAEQAGALWAHPAIYQRVKAALVARLPHDGWTISEADLVEAIEAAKRESGFSPEEFSEERVDNPRVE